MTPVHRHGAKRNCGFTIIELIVSIAVVGILVTLAIPTFSKYYRVARKVECQTSMIYYLRGQSLYYADNYNFYPLQPGQQTGWPYNTTLIAWNPANRPDQQGKYRFPDLGMEFRPDKKRGYRIRVRYIQSSWLYWQELILELQTDEDFSGSLPDPELYTYRKYNWQVTFGAWSWGTNGQWLEQNTFWFEIPPGL